MKRTFLENLKASALALAVTAPMSYVLQISMGIYIPFWYTFLFAALSLLILEVISYNKYTAIAIPAAVILLAAFVWWVLDKEQRQFFIDFYWWAVGFLYNYTTYPMGPAITLTAMTTFLVTLYIWLFGRKFFFFPAVLALVAGFVLFKWLTGLDEVLVPGLLAVGGLIPLLAKSFQRKVARKNKQALPTNDIPLFLVPIAAVIVLLSIVSFPQDAAREWQNRQVYDMLERVNNYIADYTNFNRPRNSFSIGTYGFMPMGNRLGGPTKLYEGEVLRITATRQMLLRGVVYNNYSGNRWTDTTNSERHRFGATSPDIRDNAFDMNRPELTGAALDDFRRFIEPMTISVFPIENGSSNLFVPFRGITDVTSDKFLAVLPYFNAKGEVFSSSDVHAGYSYKIKADYLIYNAGGFDEMMGALINQGLTDPSSQAIYVDQTYMNLTDNIEQSVKDLTATITKDKNNDWEKATAIRDYLSKNFVYTLSPSVPPADKDFVSWFINYDKNGYCTYYASAMAVMARIAGIPSRYVEGYLMTDKAPNSSEYIVKGSDAHAWAELYFKGIGWIPFDATPSGEAINQGAGSGLGNDNLMPTPHPTGPVESGEDIGIQPVKQPLTWDDIVPYLWVLPVGVLVLIVLWVVYKAVWTKVRVSVSHVSRKYKERSHRCAFYYSDSLKMLEYYNYPVKKGETPYAYAARIDRWLRLETGTFSEVAHLIALISYSDYVTTDDDVLFMSKFRRSLSKYTWQSVGPWFYLWHQVLGFKQHATPHQKNI